MSVAARLCSIHAGIVLLVLGLAFPTSAATLNVEFDVRTRAVEGDPAHQRKKVAVFVLDRSGSMKDPPKRGETLANGEAAENRNQLLVESFRERIRAISANEPDTIVYLVPFAGKKGEIGRSYSLKSPTDVSRLIDWDELAVEKCHGLTYLYDTLSAVIGFIDKLYDGDPSTKVSLFIYTDGDNQTGGNAVYPSILETPWGSNVPTRAQWNEYRRQLAEQEKIFMTNCGYKFETYANSGRMETYWRWLGDRQLLANSLSKTKDEYKVSLTTESPAMKNPIAVSEQGIKVTMLIPIPEKYLKNLAAAKSPIVLQLAGKNVDSQMISLEPGKKTISFRFNDNISSDNFTGELFLKDLPEWDRVALKPSAPLGLTFSAPGRLAFTAVDPKGEVFVKKGVKKVFSAKATENAEIKWSWPGGTRTGEKCEMSFEEADTFDIRLKARKVGFLDSPEEKIRVHAIDADVGVRVETQHPTAGKGVDFVAKPHGKPDSYSWQIDGQTLSERSGKVKGQMFGLGGKHSVKVTAYYGHGIIADSGDVSFDVEARPNIEIDTPESGNYDFGEKIVCKANVEGDFDKVVWELEGPSSEKQEAVVDKTAKASKPIFFVPAKGGRYTLKATANGSAGSLPAKASVALKVAHENLGVAIVSPSSGTLVFLGASEQGTNLVANVKGDRITRVKWFWRKGAGKEVEIRTTPVQDGKATCSFRPDPTTKDGESLYVRAEAVFGGDAPSEPVTSPSIELVASRYAEIDIEAKVNGNEANGREVRFGDQVELHALCKGDIDTGKVQWYESVNGMIRKMDSARGSHCTSPKEVPDKSLPNGDNLRTVHYFAVAGLSDGSAVTSRTVVVHHYCPDVKFAIKLPPGEDGFPRRSFRPGDMIHLHLPDGDSFADVEWDFGDGAKATGDNVEHSYSDEKSHKVTAKGRCAKCGKPFSAVVDVSTKCPDLELAVVLKGDERFAKKYGLKKPVNVELSVKNGEAADVTWNFGDGCTAKGMEASHSYEKYDTYTITASANCKRCGKRFTASSEKIEVTIIPPQAVLEIEQKGSHYGTGDTINLSAEKSKGDIVDCVWEVDGKELVEFRGKKEADLPLPDSPCEMVAKLTLIGPEGTEPSEAQREIRVRYGAKYMALLIVLVVFLVCVLAWLLLNNGPAGWMVKLYSCKAIDHTTPTGKDMEIENIEGEVLLPIVGLFWSFLNKKAVIPFEKVLANESLCQFLTFETQDFMRTCSNAKIIVNPNPDPLNDDESLIYCGADNGNPPVLVPYKPVDEIAVNRELNNPNLDYRQFVRNGDKSKEPEVLRFLLDRSDVTHKYEIWFVVLTLCVIVAASWAALKFAI